MINMQAIALDRRKEMKLVNNELGKEVELDIDKMCWKTFFLGPLLLWSRGQVLDGFKMYFYSAFTLGFYWVYYSQKSNHKYANFLVEKKGFKDVQNNSSLKQVA